MLIKFKQWFSSISNNKQLGLLFIAWWIFWVLGEYVIDVAWPDDEPKSIKQVIFAGTFMSVWFTVTSHWKKVKLVFKKKVSDDTKPA